MVAPRQGARTARMPKVQKSILERAAQGGGRAWYRKARTMTIAISLKVNDGLVLAADSASTLLVQGPGGAIGVANVYNNANKIFNLKKNIPVGAVTWGLGSIGNASM